VHLVERRRHLWNQKWGRLSRRDIVVREDGGTWWVEAREGGAAGRTRVFELPDEDTALDCVRDLVTASGQDGWKDLPVADADPQRFKR
jgi:hypothetical protein